VGGWRGGWVWPLAAAVGLELGIFASCPLATADASGSSADKSSTTKGIDNGAEGGFGAAPSRAVRTSLPPQRQPGSARRGLSPAHRESVAQPTAAATAPEPLPVSATVRRTTVPTKLAAGPTTGRLAGIEDVGRRDATTTSNPLQPLQNSVAISVLAWVRKEFDPPLPGVTAASAQAPVASAVPNANSPSVGSIFQYTLFNKAPTASPAQSPGQSPTGVVTGSLHAAGLTGAILTYSVAGNPSNGTVQINSDGIYTYTPTTDFAHNGGADSFTVTIDGSSAFRLTGLAGAIQSLLHSLTRMLGLSGPDTANVVVPVSIATVNKPPEISGSAVDSPNLTGVVVGSVSATDPDADNLSFTGPTQSSGGGTISVQASGTFTYTPTAEQRHAASTDSAPLGATTDSVTVTVSDGHGGTAHITISLPVSPTNAAPTGGAVTPLSMNGTTGAVSGAISGVTDSDGDSLAYSATPPGSGSITINAASGAFVYTPTDAARHAASASNAPAAVKTDTFTVMVSDGHGGSTGVPVNVSISPANATPGNATSTISEPSPTTGAVTGKITSIDSDGDALTYSGSTTTSKGTVTVTAAGNFTYTPTATARHAASVLTATAGDRTDSFTVTVTDGHGGTATVPVTVQIGTSNAAPTVGSPAVGAPNANSVVTGSLTAADSDGDTLTYSGPTSTSKGTVTVAANGTFTYTPTATARHAASATGATTADKTDVFTLTVSDGHGATVNVPIIVTISPKNTAPVAGTPTIGAPNATTGVVSGTLNATDSDGDTLTYSGSTTTSKGTVVVNANGTFTYEPTAMARHNAAFGVGAAVTGDSFVVSAVDGHGATITIPVAVTVSPAAITFNFAYGSGSQYWTTDARNALQAVASELSSYIVVNQPVTLTYTVTGTNTPGTAYLANALAPFTTSAAGFYGTVAQTKVLTGVDVNGLAADGQISWDFSFSWAYSGTVDNNSYDFRHIALHELLHTVGFLTGLEGPSGTDQNWVTFDSFLETANGVPVIGANYVYNSAYLANMTGGNGGLYFGGPNAVAAYGGPVPLYTPGTWITGTSVAHLRDTNVNAAAQVMNPSEDTGPHAGVLSPVEIGILRDLGYTVTDQPAIYAFLFIGFRLRRKRKADRPFVS